jgi:ornithine carbamoyltransferase
VTSLATGTVDRLRGADFLDIAELDRPELEAILDLAGQIKTGTWSGSPLDGRTLALLFHKPSMRTRVSFQVGISRLGGSTVALGKEEVGLGQRESVADAARVLDRYVDGIVARVSSHEHLLQLAAASERPVINALSDASHPCQVLADLLTMRESLGRLDGSTRVIFVGDGNNVASSLMEASTLVGFPLTVISPAAYRPKAELLERAPGVSVTTDLQAVAGAAVVYTDVWTSMGQEAESEARRAEFAEYQVDGRLMELAPEALFMHCLPAHRGEEVTSQVIDGPRSVVLDQAGNRLHAQMALLALIYGED